MQTLGKVCLNLTLEYCQALASEVLVLTPCSIHGRAALSRKKKKNCHCLITGIDLAQIMCPLHSLSAFLWVQNALIVHQVLTTAVLSLHRGTVLRKLENAANLSLDCHHRRGPLTFKAEIF